MKRVMHHGVMILLGFAALILSGCSASKQVNQKEIVWPDPPDPPRVRYEKTYRNEDDFGGGLNKIAAALAGANTKISFQRPFDVCSDGNGQIFVSDALNGVVRIDEINRKYIGLWEKSNLPLNNPRGIAVWHNKVFVGLPNLGQIAVLNYDGEVQYTIGRKRQYINPLDVVIDTIKGRVLVVDNELHKVVVYTESGDSLFALGVNPRSALDGDFNRPQAVAVDAQSNIYVDDAFNFRMQVFDSTGKFVKKFGTQGDTWGSFALMKGMAIDTFGHIYVLDAQHQNFQIFDTSGTLLMFVGKFSSGNDGFQDPVSMYIDKNNRIYVTDQLNERLQIFDLLKGD
jgi:hypothetical protein